LGFVSNFGFRPEALLSLLDDAGPTSEWIQFSGMSPPAPPQFTTIVAPSEKRLMIHVPPGTWQHLLFQRSKYDTSATFGIADFYVPIS